MRTDYTTRNAGLQPMARYMKKQSHMQMIREVILGTSLILMLVGACYAFLVI